MRLFKFFITLATASVLNTACGSASDDWILIDDFESGNLTGWIKIDAQNDTEPHIENPQISEIQTEPGNQFLMRKPAAEGIVGNRKALIYKALPVPIAAGMTYTVYSRINVEYFPNNHSYGLTNIAPENIAAENYNAFESMIRITDKAESDGTKNDGTIMVLSGYKKYSKIQNADTSKDALPPAPGTWYEIWTVINNAGEAEGGQTYDLYMRGGEFETQTPVYKNAVFRMKREQPLTGFIAITNTGPKKSPYGNGGVRYDDLYLAEGQVLSTPGQR